MIAQLSLMQCPCLCLGIFCTLCWYHMHTVNKLKLNRIICIPLSIDLPTQQVRFNCDIFPPWRLQGKIWLIIPSPCILGLQSTTLPYYSFYIELCVNNVVNTCTCTDVFTVITTKDQSGGIYNDNTGGQGFCKQASSSGYILRLSLFIYCHKSLPQCYV